MNLRWIWVFAVLACTACTGANEAPPTLTNIEVTGSPECLAKVVHIFDNHGVGAATMPKWANGLGSMEFGPIEVATVPQARSWVRVAECVRAVRQRPCSAPNTDVALCGASKRSE